MRSCAHCSMPTARADRLCDNCLVAKADDASIAAGREPGHVAPEVARKLEVLSRPARDAEAGAA